MIRGSNTRQSGWLVEAVASGKVPVYPGPGIIPTVRVPPPPMFDHGMDDNALAHRALSAYRTAHRLVYNRQSWVLSKGNLSKSKQYRGLVVAGDVLRGYEVAPLAWAVWSMRAWIAWKGSEKSAPIHWIYALTRIDTKMFLFERESTSTTYARVVFTNEQKVLMSRYRAFISEANATPKNEFETVVAKHFADGIYVGLVADAKRSATRLQHEINNAVKNGEWVW